MKEKNAILHAIRKTMNLAQFPVQPIIEISVKDDHNGGQLEIRVQNGNLYTIRASDLILTEQSS